MVSYSILTKLFLLASTGISAALNQELEEKDDKKWFEAQLISEGLSYIPKFTAYLGTPSQKVELQFDTGSDQTWAVNGDLAGQYNPNKSSTAKFINDKFSMGYIGFSAKGRTYIENIGSDESAQVPLLLGVADKGNATRGLLGASPQPNATVGFFSALKEKKIIDKQAFSFYGHHNPNNFTVIAGGIDHEKYEGELKFHPYTQRRTFGWILETVGFDGKNASTNNAVIFDTGSDYLFFDKQARDQVIKLVDGKAVNSFQIAYGGGKKCEDISTDPFTFNFDTGVSLNISIDSISFWSEEHKSCLLRVDENSANLIGSQAISNLYLAFDHDAKTIAAANAKISTKSNIQPIV